MAERRTAACSLRAGGSVSDGWPLAPQLDAGHLTSSNSGWRTRWPEITVACTRCGLCFLYCPDGAIAKEGDGTPRVAPDWCKGCGVCAVECPKGAIEMRDERKGRIER
ncbi:4Fe-4S binding protein [Telmatospirillum siberiense]|nr:4Fe-4S binding protein [Telmatospirillum siberiense]